VIKFKIRFKKRRVCAKIEKSEELLTRERRVKRLLMS
jgi:hypothetical protein